MFAGLAIELLLLLVLVAFLAGIGITTIGPGGIFVTIALYVFTPLSSAEVAGTAHATFVASGVVATAAYIRSGELIESESWRMAAILGGSSVVGAPLGAHLNTYVSRRLFGVLLGAAAAATGVLLVYREWREFEPKAALDAETRRGRITLVWLGLTLGVAAGLVGVGGPVFAVPALVMLGVPILLGLGVAQVQSVFISGFATAGYLSYDAVAVQFVVLVGVPQLTGVVVGWTIAHRVDPGQLKRALGTALVFVGAYLIL